MSYSVVAVPAYELPEFLLEQKPGYNIGAFFHQAMNSSDKMLSYVVEDDDNVIACFWAHYSPLYKAVHVDTIVVDKEFRNEKTVGDVMRIARTILSKVASEIGADKITWSSPPKLAERTMKYLEGAHVTEWVVTIDLDQGGEDDSG